MTLTESRQRNAVSEGMALGLVLCGHESISESKASIDLSVVGAWRAWPYSAHFPRVDSQVQRFLDGTRVMTHAEESHQTWVFYWSRSWPPTICRRDPSWNAADPSDVEHAVNMIDGDVPADGWMRLAEDFWNRLVRPTGTR